MRQKPSTRMRPVTRRRVLVVIMTMIASGLAAVLSVAAPAAAATAEYAELGAPFSGKWGYNAFVSPPYTDANSSHPAVHKISGGGDFSTDYYGSVGQEVRLRVGAATGNLSFTWAASTTSCGTSTRVNIYVDGQFVGWVYFAHLVGAVRSGPISNGMVLGTVGNFSCAPGRHVHIEVKADDGNRACYQDHGRPGNTIGDGTKFAALGNTRTGGMQMACTSGPPPGGDTFGAFDVIERAPGGAYVAGWVIDPNSAASTAAHVYGGDGRARGDVNPSAALAADQSRLDVAAVYPDYGDRHGYGGGIGLGVGHHNVCVYGINIDGTPGISSPLGCKTIDINPEPFGRLDSVTPRPGGVRAQGWAIDPDVWQPNDVHIYGGDGGGDPYKNPSLGITANLARGDVGNVYHHYGDNHGYDVLMPLSPGRHTVCAYSINFGGTSGSSQATGCHAVDVPAKLRPTLTLRAPRRARTSSAFSLTGQLAARDTGRGSVPIQVWRRYGAGKWVRAGVVPTTSKAIGTWQFRTTIRRSATFTVSAAGSFTEQPATSRIVTVTLAKRRR